MIAPNDSIVQAIDFGIEAGWCRCDDNGRIVLTGTTVPDPVPGFSNLGTGSALHAKLAHWFSTGALDEYYQNYFSRRTQEALRDAELTEKYGVFVGGTTGLASSYGDGIVPLTGQGKYSNHHRRAWQNWQLLLKEEGIETVLVGHVIRNGGSTRPAPKATRAVVASGCIPAYYSFRQLWRLEIVG